MESEPVKIDSIIRIKTKTREETIKALKLIEQFHNLVVNNGILDITEGTLFYNE